MKNRKRGSSEQSVQTPKAFIEAVQVRFGQITFDLAADEHNAQASSYFTEAEDSLVHDWPKEGVLWLNPPFQSIGPWAAKCNQWLKKEPSQSALIAFLVPASVDSNWWAQDVTGRARALAVSPRLQFVGHKDPYPKPMALCIYDARFPSQSATIEPWRWK